MVSPIPVEIGGRYGRLTALARVDGSTSTFRCDCGVERALKNKAVRSGNTKSCGCLHAERAAGMSHALGRSNLSVRPGQVFGRLTAIDNKSSTTTLFLCSCGTSKVVRNKDVHYGVVQSCGCLQLERCGNSLNSKGGYAYRGQPEYRVWSGMRYRCLNQNNPAWRYYGAKGVKVCSEWEDFAKFFSDMGPRPGVGFSIDRVDGDGDYSRDNCRWATIYEQNQNRSNVSTLTVWGVTKPTPEWAHEFGLQPQTLRQRLARGVLPEYALTTPLRGQHAA